MTQRQEPGLSREAIVSDLRALGLEAGALVLVHSSLSSLGWVEGSAPTVIDALLEAVSPDGTVLVPTLTGTIQDGPHSRDIPPAALGAAQPPPHALGGRRWPGHGLVDSRARILRHPLRRGQ